MPCKSPCHLCARATRWLVRSLFDFISFVVPFVIALFVLLYLAKEAETLAQSSTNDSIRKFLARKQALDKEYAWVFDLARAPVLPLTSFFAASAKSDGSGPSDIVHKLRENLHATFPGEAEFVERTVLAFADSRGDGKPLRFAGPKMIGKRLLAKVIGHSLGDPANHVIDYQSVNWPSNTFYKSLSDQGDVTKLISAIRNHIKKHPTDALVCLSNTIGVDSVVMKTLDAFFTGEEWRGIKSPLVLIDDIGGARSEVRLRPGMDLDDARDLLKDYLDEKNSNASKVISEARLVPFLPKSARVVEDHLQEICERVSQSFQRKGHLVCDVKAVAQAAIKLDHCIESTGLLPILGQFEQALHDRLNSAATKASRKNGLKGVVLALDVEITESGCSIPKWLRIKALEAF